MLPPNPEAQRWRERRLTLLAGAVLVMLGVVIGWWIRRADCLTIAAEQAISTLDSLHAAQCAQLAPELRPGLCP
mgnify:CR=1 FL=1